jgi:hypothetical protein
VGKTEFMPRNKPEKCFDPFVSHLCAKIYMFRNRIFRNPGDGCGTLLRKSYETLQGVKKLKEDKLFPKLGYQIHRNVDLHILVHKQKLCTYQHYRTFNIKVKGTFHSGTGHEGPEGG